MFTVTEVVTVARSRCDVFDYLTDAGNRPQWDTTVVSEELTSPLPLGVGSSIRTHMSVLGRHARFDWLVTGYHAPVGMMIVSTAGPMRSALTLKFDVVGSGCRVTATIEARPGGMMRLVEPMIADATRTTLADGLARAKQILEEPGGPRP